MSVPASSGSTPQRSASASGGFLHSENTKQMNEGVPGLSLDTTSSTLKKSVTVLGTSKLANIGHPKMSFEAAANETYPMDKLLAKLSEQEAVISQQNAALKTTNDDMTYARALDNHHASSGSSLPITPANDAFPPVPLVRPASATVNNSQTKDDEVLRLKLELAQAQNEISHLNQELTQTRMKHGEAETLAFNGRAAPATPRNNGWTIMEDSTSDASDAVSTNNGGLAARPWGGRRSQLPSYVDGSQQPSASEAWYRGSGFQNGYMDPNGPYSMTDGFRGQRLSQDQDGFVRPMPGRRGGRFENRFDNQFASRPTSWNGYRTGAGFGPYDGMNVGLLSGGSGSIVPGTMAGFAPFPAHGMGTALSPTATEFTSNIGWKDDAMTIDGPTYLPTTEPLNYRKLLDRNVNCNWKYIVDKIVCNNDQQASIFLQQKLKVGTAEQKYEIIEAIVAQAYPLMVNRFGNFLVQRCFEHGTPDQVIKIAEAIRGNTLNLSMDPFGCHVVQKAFDSVPEDYKAIMVKELLRRIPDTVIHRYACHVWQKLFELRWTKQPPKIMKYVNEALRGMWHEVALGETGSLVVQNIFENCLEEDKRPCIEEVLANIDIVAHGQFGNWCIQHICEHGAPGDRSRAIDHVIRYAAEYSTDQFASKVVEKCLKIGGTEFLNRYLDRVCEGRADRPRIPLIDIASDQYGNYLVQYILTHCGAQHREIVAAHIRKHMVSLRGSKFGSRVGMLCTNPAVATRPGPGVGPGMGGRMPPRPHYSGTYR